MKSYPTGVMAVMVCCVRTGIAVALLAAIAAGCTRDASYDSVRSPRYDLAGVPGVKERPETLLQIANSTAARGDVAGAVRLYRRAHELDRDKLEPLIGLGKSLAALGALNEAAEAYRTAIRIEKVTRLRHGRKPSDAYIEALLGLGNVLISLDQPNDAITQFETALNLKENARAYNGIGVAHDMLGDHMAARAFYRTGLAISPRNLSLLNNLGLSLAVTGAFDEAIKVMRRAAVDARAGSRNRLNLALVYGLAGQTDEAAEIARIDLDEASVRSNLAYYKTLRAMNDRRATLGAIGAHGVFRFDSGLQSVGPRMNRVPRRN